MILTLPAGPLGLSAATSVVRPIAELGMVAT